MKILLLALLSIGMSVAAQFALKAGMSAERAQAAFASLPRPGAILQLFTVPGIAIGFALYGLGAVVWLSVLSRWDVSKAYPLVGVGFALAVGIGWLLGESVNAQRIAGVALIVAGIVLTARS
jgi:multidrug transporter EmrE-like cation transporter